MKLNALILNCTLKKSPEKSNTQAFIAHAEKEFNKLNVNTEVIRVIDKSIAFGTTSDEGEDDAWPSILKKIKAADMLILATPIWRGDRSSIAKLVAERLDGVMSEENEDSGQLPTYNKVAGVLVDGNEDGAKKAIASMFFDLSEHGFTIPINAFTYYVGSAGPGPSYIKAKANKHEFTNYRMLLMIHNMVHLSTVLQKYPYNTKVSELKKKAEQMST